MLARSQADVILLQESRLQRADRLMVAERSALANGWKPALTLAHATATAHLGSGGCCVLRKRGAGLRNTTEAYITEQHRHRVCLGWADGVVKGGMHFASVYLRDSEGLTPANMAILDELAVALRSLKGPWIVGGDWNIPPEVLAAARWPETVGGKIFATGLPTCNESTYDFFVVHHSLAHAVVGVQRLEDGGFTPHWATRLLLRGDARRYAVRKLCKPPLVPGALPVGPQLRPPSYDEVRRLVDEGAADQAMVAWYANARLEWTALVGTDLRHFSPRFKWLPAAGAIAKPWSGSTALSVMWRVLARRADEIGRLLEKGVSHLRPSQIKVLIQHLAAATTAAGTLCNSQRAEVEPVVRTWAASLHAATCRCSPRWITSLTFVANTKAKLLEEWAHRARVRQWRVALGASTAAQDLAKAPTKLAYRWVKGLAGWQQSPIGDAAANDEVPALEGMACEEEEAYLDEAFAHNPAEAAVRGKRLMPLSDQAAVEAEADKWGALWQEARQYRAMQGECRLPLLRLLAPRAIRDAAASFPVGTGLGADNIAPRAVMRLSEEALVLLALLFALFEQAGSWAAVLDLVLIVLLPKSDACQPCTEGLAWVPRELRGKRRSRRSWLPCSVGIMCRLCWTWSRHSRRSRTTSSSRLPWPRDIA